MKVLVVDDEPGMVNTLEAGLVSAGYQVVTASNGGQALQIIKLSSKKAEPVGLLVTDLIMPGINGLDLVELARQLLPGLPAILVTAYGVDNVCKDAMSLGSCEYLEKPFNMSVILPRLSTNSLVMEGEPLFTVK